MSGKGYRGFILICILLAGILVVSIVIYFFPFLFFSDDTLRNLSRVAFSEQELPVTLTIFGRSSDSINGREDTISARIAFFTPDGESAGSVERSWQGWELNIDCIMVSSGTGWLVFPYRVFTDKTALGQGTVLFDQYTSEGLPLLYTYPELTRKERAILHELFSIVKTEQWLPRFLGTLHHETVSIRSFEAGKEYSFFVTKNGKLTLRRN